MQAVDQLSDEELAFLVNATMSEMDSILENHSYTTRFIGICEGVTSVLSKEYKRRSLDYRMFVKKTMIIEIDEQ